MHPDLWCRRSSVQWVPNRQTELILRNSRGDVNSIDDTYINTPLHSSSGRAWGFNVGMICLSFSSITCPYSPLEICELFRVNSFSHRYFTNNIDISDCISVRSRRELSFISCQQKIDWWNGLDEGSCQAWPDVSKKSRHRDSPPIHTNTRLRHFRPRMRKKVTVYLKLSNGFKKQNI